MRVAVISDVHGNLPALEAALAAARAARPDAIVFGGDLVWGPLPRKTLERILAVEGALFVRGDADRDVVDRAGEVSEWAARQLTAKQLESLTAQPETLALEIDGLGPTLFCHGSPRSHQTGSPSVRRRRRFCPGSRVSRSASWSAATHMHSSTAPSVHIGS